MVISFKKILFILFFLILTSCSTSIIRSQKDVKVGMNKSDVLELMGNPKYTFRRDSKDYWIYRYFHDDKEHENIVVFKEGEVVNKTKPVIRPRLLMQLSEAEDMKEYEKKVVEFQEAQDQSKNSK